MEHGQMIRVLRQMRDALDSRRAGPDNGDALVGELVQISVGIAAGVSVVPSTGVEGVPFEAVDAGDPGKFRPVQRPIGHDYESRAHPIVAVGGNDPSALVFIPGDRFDRGLKAGVAIEIELFADATRVGQDFRREGVLLLRDVAGLLEQRQIYVRLNIALRTGIAVPVPGAAEVATFLDDADILHTGLAQTRAGKEASEAAADDQNVNRVGQRRASESRRDVGIIDVVAVVALHFDVLFIAVGADAFVALLAILGAQQFGVEVEFLSTIAGGWRFVSVAHCGNSQIVLMPGK